MLLKANLVGITDDGCAYAQFKNGTIEVEQKESITKMYLIVIDEYENGIIIDTTLPSGISNIYTSKERALQDAYYMAEEEHESIEEDFPDNHLISYGVVDSECNGEFITLNKYILESEFDTTGETEILTKYRVIEYTVISE